jgi:hypothetical protein
MNELKIGDIIPAGTTVILSTGAHSDYYVIGVFRALRDTVIPGKPRPAWQQKMCEHYRKTLIADLELLSTQLEKIPTIEIHSYPD